MTDSETSVNEGACRCGSTRFTVTGLPLITTACHCRGCQTMTAGPFSLSSLYPAEAFAPTQGTPVLGGIKGGTKHHFCPDCLSWLYTVPEGMDDFVNIRSAMLSDFDGHAPYAEFYLDEGLTGMKSGAVKSFGMAPDYDGFMQLMEEFAKLPN